MQSRTDTCTVQISNVNSIAKICTPFHSFIILSIKNKKIFLASKQYKQSDKTQSFYDDHQIKANVSLKEIPHGNENDIAEYTLPLFLKAANKMNEHLSQHNNILVNCNHGRSRSGAVIVLYLMEYCHFNASNAIKVVEQALKKRGFEGGVDLKGRCSGSYGDWIREYENKNNLENQEHIAPYTKNQVLTRSKRLAEPTFFASSKKLKKEEQTIKECTNIVTRSRCAY